MTIVKGLRFAEGIGGIESVTELHVRKDDKDYYVMVTDMGDFQKVHIAENPLLDEYKRIIRLPNDEFAAEVERFMASALYVEDKEASKWYNIKSSPFESAVKLTALVSKECPYGEEKVYVEKANQVIADYIDRDIDEMNLPETYDDPDEEYLLYGFEKGESLAIFETLEEAREAAFEYQDEVKDDISIASYYETEDDDIEFVEEIEVLVFES